MAKYAFGVDVGGTTVKLGLFTAEGEVLDKWEIPTRTENHGEAILPDIAAAVKAKAVEKNIESEDVLGVGIDVPGPVLEDGSVSVCVNLGWEKVDVAKDLSALLNGAKVKVANDANAAGLGEMWKGGGRGYKNVVMVTLGTGVGGGVVIDGQIVPGSHGAGAEIGHMQVSLEETDVCNCGKTGCLEQFTAANGIVRVAKRDLKSNTLPTKLVDNAELSAKLIFDAAKEGDAFALEQVDKFGQVLGRALASIACVVDPEVFVIGGGVSKAGTIVTDAVEKYYGPAAFQACRAAAFKLAELGNDAGIYGAVKMVL